MKVYNVCIHIYIYTDINIICVYVYIYIYNFKFDRPRYPSGRSLEISNKTMLVHPGTSEDLRATPSWDGLPQPFMMVFRDATPMWWFP